MDTAPEREYPTRPIVGVGVVVARDGKVIIVRRGRQPAYGEWTIPGGAVELGETLAEAAAREVLEECAIAVEVQSVVEVIDRVLRDDDGRVRYHYVLIDFVARYRSGELHAGSDATAACWVQVDDLASFGVADLTQAVIRKAIAALTSA